MNTAKLTLYSMLSVYLIFCGPNLTCSAIETLRGIVHQTEFPSCSFQCDAYNLQPDSGYDFSYLKAGIRTGIVLSSYLGAHVEVSGYRDDCGGCADFIIVSIVPLVTSVMIGGDETLPIVAILSQNYPNPFNPKTDVGFRIADFSTEGGSAYGGGFVTLKVLDMLGREVVTLVNEKRMPGSYTVSWNGRDSPSGVYFYRLQVGNFIQVKKMILLR